MNQAKKSPQKDRKPASAQDKKIREQAIARFEAWQRNQKILKTQRK